MNENRHSVIAVIVVAVVVVFLLAVCLDRRAAANAQKSDRSRHPYASAKPMTEPRVFAEGTLCTGDYESHPAFTPDGKTIYFLKNNPNFTFWTIVVSHFEGGRWTTPDVAPFSGQYSDADPFITPDGKRFYFISSRPINRTAGEPPKDDLDIWVMERTARGWSEPVNLGAPVNSPGNEWYPTIATSGTIYFGSDREGGKGRTDLYRSRLVNGKYIEAENLGEPFNTQFNEFEPLIAPDESFLIFMCGGRADARGGFDLYLSYNRNGAWTKPVNLGDKINSSGNELSPKISPDGKYFFWTSTRDTTNKPLEKPLTYRELSNRLRSPGNGLGDIYQIDIDALKIEH
jgi:Tol biopolymer transport system component